MTVGVDRSLAYQHLERLVAYDLVVLLPGEREDDEKLCFHPDHAHLWEHEETRILYGQAPLRQVALYVEETPGTATAEIEVALEAAARTIQEYLATLREHGLVDRDRFRRRVEHHSTGTLEAWADKVGDRYRRPWTDTD